MGVWIETELIMKRNEALLVTPCVGVWIETAGCRVSCAACSESHPAWVCGLKLKNVGILRIPKSHTLRGCVD